MDVLTVGRVGVDLYPEQSGVPLHEVRTFARSLGGTATNVTLAYLREGVEIVTGVNLPMLIKYANIRDKCSLREAAALIKEQGQRSIAIATEYLGSPGRGRTQE